MFERYSDEARESVKRAIGEASELGHDFIGTEHILLGLIPADGPPAIRTFTNCHVDPQVVRERLIELIGRNAVKSNGHIPFTPRAKKVLELTLREALQLGHGTIYSEHILLGLIREGDGVAAQLLTRFGMDLTRARQQFIIELPSRINAERQETSQQTSTLTIDGVVVTLEADARQLLANIIATARTENRPVGVRHFRSALNG